MLNVWAVTPTVGRVRLKTKLFENNIYSFSWVFKPFVSNKGIKLSKNRNAGTGECNWNEIEASFFCPDKMKQRKDDLSCRERKFVKEIREPGLPKRVTMTVASW